MLIDSLDFARKTKQLSGEIALNQLPRVMQGLSIDQNDVLVVWSVRGYQNSVGRSFLELQVNATVHLQCQRCMQVFDYPIAVTSVLELVQSEQDLGDDSLESIWEEVQNESEQAFFSDKILASSKLNMQDLIEDEIILAIPYVPKHEQCGQDQAFSTAQDELEQSPFAILKQLKTK